MNKKLISSLVAGLALSAAATGANAFYLSGYDGPISFVLSGADEGALYSRSCLSASLCDVTPQSAVQGGVPGEDSWGIFQVTSILGGPSGNTTLWTSGTDGEYLVGKFGGVVDVSATVFGLNQLTWSNGGSFEMFLTGNSTLISTAILSGPTGATTRSSITGTPFVSGSFAGTADANIGGFMASDPTVPWQPNSAFNTFFPGALSLGSTGYMDLTSGDYLPMFKQLVVPDQGGNMQDAKYSFTWDTASSAANAGWTVPFKGGVSAAVIPEPGSMALVGLGLMGLAGLRRRKQQA